MNEEFPLSDLYQMFKIGPNCDRCGGPLSEGSGSASIFIPGEGTKTTCMVCPDIRSQLWRKEVNKQMNKEAPVIVYKIRRPDGKFKGNNGWSKHGKTWSCLNDLKGHLRLSKRYPEGTLVVSYELSNPKERPLEDIDV